MLISESDYTHSRDLVDQVFVIERGVVTPNDASLPCRQRRLHAESAFAAGDHM